MTQCRNQVHFWLFSSSPLQCDWYKSCSPPLLQSRLTCAYIFSPSTISTSKSLISSLGSCISLLRLSCFSSPICLTHSCSYNEMPLIIYKQWKCIVLSFSGLSVGKGLLFRDYTCSLSSPVQEANKILWASLMRSWALCSQSPADACLLTLLHWGLNFSIWVGGRSI